MKIAWTGIAGSQLYEEIFTGIEALGSEGRWRCFFNRNNIYAKVCLFKFQRNCLSV